jgi:hypothetical protein
MYIDKIASLNYMSNCFLSQRPSTSELPVLCPFMILFHFKSASIFLTNSLESYLIKGAFDMLVRVTVNHVSLHADLLQ